MWAGLTDLHIKTPMGVTAENLAEKYQITREDCDNYAYQTQQRWKAGEQAARFDTFHELNTIRLPTFELRRFCFPAHDGGRFTAEMAPVDVKVKKGVTSVAQDEHPRPQTTLEQMAKLPTVFKKGGTVTAANASVSSFKLLQFLGFYFNERFK